MSVNSLASSASMGFTAVTVAAVGDLRFRDDGDGDGDGDDDDDAGDDGDDDGAPASSGGSTTPSSSATLPTRAGCDRLFLKAQLRRVRMAASCSLVQARISCYRSATRRNKKRREKASETVHQRPTMLDRAENIGSCNTSALVGVWLGTATTALSSGWRISK